MPHTNKASIFYALIKFRIYLVVKVNEKQVYPVNPFMTDAVII